MIRKIISGGEGPVEAAALDVAMQLEIPCGGWRTDSAGPPVEGCRIRTLPAGGRTGCIEKNVREADGTLVLNFGPLDKDSDHARRMTLKHRRQLLAVDPVQTDRVEAAGLVRSWIGLYRIGAVYVTGPGESRSADIYPLSAALLTLAFGEEPIGSKRVLNRSFPLREVQGRPASVAAAVERLTREMPLRDRAALARIQAPGPCIHSPLGVYIRTAFAPGPGNRPLLAACRDAAGDPHLDADGAVSVIIRALRDFLASTHALRRIK